MTFVFFVQKKKIKTIFIIISISRWKCYDASNTSAHTGWDRMLRFRFRVLLGVNKYRFLEFFSINLLVELPGIVREQLKLYCLASNRNRLSREFVVLLKCFRTGHNNFMFFLPVRRRTNLKGLPPTLEHATQS